mgnify:CR=1 FL=1
MLIHRIAVARHQVAEEIGMGIHVALEIHGHEAGELDEAGIDLPERALALHRHVVDPEGAGEQRLLRHTRLQVLQLIDLDDPARHLLRGGGAPHRQRRRDLGDAVRVARHGVHAPVCCAGANRDDGPCLRRETIEHFHVPPDDIRVIPNFVDLDKYNRGAYPCHRAKLARENRQ